MSRHIVNINGHNISYIQKGNASKSILFIHGMGCNAITWKHQYNALSEHFSCYAIDLPGHGFTDLHNFQTSIYNYSKLIIDFIAELKIDTQNLSVVAHSMGGQIAFLSAIRNPALASFIYLIAPAGIESFNVQQKNMIEQSLELLNYAPIIQKAKTLRYDFWIRKQSAAFQEIIDMIEEGNDHDSFEQYIENIKLCTRAMINEPVDVMLKNISIPMKIVWGDGDNMIPNPIFYKKLRSEFPNDVKAILPNAQFSVISNASHFPQIEFVNLINQDIEMSISSH